ncbi:hypothetical protein M011DRAFT_457114 [Sporormia fimetaria CBS 119925]|uniref:RGS domain-containing protein n=1 Tax=Sporormia fimetaria CBS 119925 TaxID=1340428 RepID=A0A6A6VHF3_9PLEO|nr:hypothetical protein M011DRAFT_457114 [Sporormia fimetaria CBS 119925]
MVYSITYRRPVYVRAFQGPAVYGVQKDKPANESLDSSNTGMVNGIPEALSFDRIVAGGVCPPCTVRDFTNYLKYIELAAENLQFYLWYKDYSRRFNELPEHEQLLSPEWIGGDLDTDTVRRPKKTSADVNAIFKGTDFANGPKVTTVEKVDPFDTPPLSSDGQSCDGSTSFGAQFNHSARAKAAFEGAGLQWKPLSVQPYRAEIDRIVSIYIADDGPRQLNLSSKERTNLLHALQNTTHPSAFREVATSVEWSLRCQAHPNFIRWTICNGNRPRVLFARGLGVAGIVLGLVTAIVLSLSGAGRAWRAMAALGMFIGTSTLIAAAKGMCVVLHGMHHRHLRPWELFSDDDCQGYDEKAESLEQVTPQSISNSYEDEPWVAKYDKRNIIRKIFDREVWIEEPALRQIQDTIFLQAVLGALLASAITVGVFLAIPHYNFFHAN